MRWRDFLNATNPAKVSAFAVRTLIAFVLSVVAFSYSATAQTSFVAPPRSTADITAILDQEKPDQAKAAKTRADADANPPSSNDDRNLAQFYFSRAQARASVGRNVEAIADCQQAILHGTKTGGDIDGYNVARYKEFMSNQYNLLGDSTRTIEINLELVQQFGQPGRGGRPKLFVLYQRIVVAYLAIGNLAQAESYQHKSRALLVESRAWKNVDPYRSSWEAIVESSDARLLDARGRYREAELAYHHAQDLTRDALAKSSSWPRPPFKGAFESTIDFLTAWEGQTKERQGRLSEAEADIRRALLSRLEAVGKYHSDIAQISLILSGLVYELRRFDEAEKLARTAVEIYRTLGYAESVPVLAFAQNQVATTLYAQRKYIDAAEIYATLDKAAKNWEPTRRDRLELGWPRIFVDYYISNLDAGIELARRLVAFRKGRVGEQHYEYAMARGILGAGLVFAGRDAEALQEYKAALPMLLTNWRDGEDDSTAAVANDNRMQIIVEPYLVLLARNRGGGDDIAAESFQVGETLRGRSVEKALSESGARIIANNAALAELVRREQDLQKEIEAQLGVLNNMLTLPSDQREEKQVSGLRATIDDLRTQRATTRRDIQRRFPDYADLISPQPATVENVRAVLRDREAFLSIYLGARNAFVWAIPKEGPVAFASIPLGRREINNKVRELRRALEPDAATISDIPAFDLDLAYELYGILLKPVESGWKPAKSLIVEANGALGLLPLSLLPVAPAQIATNTEPPFVDYRDVPWLARTHAVTIVPSASALRTLRRLPHSSNKREPFIGFGDPIFSKAQAAAAMQTMDGSATVADAITRGMPLKRRAAPELDGVASADLAMLPRLPDTAGELKSIAIALEADPSKVLNLGIKANEQIVETADLSRYKIVAFATHGLVPGELDGLTQPALALTAPDVAGVEGDGLLTMDKILALKLDADWVVLSACNTGTAAGAGAEAASGLGRAFFYAGTRAILVTNWSVHSASARELVTDLFRRQAKDPKITRAEALRQAMLALMDGGGFKDDSGKMLFSYAHPLFWAPYTIIGDGG